VALPKAAKPLDRRQRRSRAALRAGLLDLIGEVPYDTITIDQIVDRADVGRATFYSHYLDKADLLRELTDELISDVAVRARAHHSDGVPDIHSGEATGEIIKHAGEHPDLYRLVLSGAGGTAARDRLFSAVRAVAEEVFPKWIAAGRGKARVPMSFTATAYVGATMAVIEHWLAGTIKGSAEEVAVMLSRGQVEGIRWALGLPPSALEFKQPKSRRHG
jgi:AcrR family transcriptional regulator